MPYLRITVWIYPASNSQSGQVRYNVSRLTSNLLIPSGLIRNTARLHQIT